MNKIDYELMILALSVIKKQSEKLITEIIELVDLIQKIEE